MQRAGAEGATETTDEGPPNAGKRDSVVVPTIHGLPA